MTKQNIIENAAAYITNFNKNVDCYNATRYTNESIANLAFASIMDFQKMLLGTDLKVAYDNDGRIVSISE